MNHHSNNSECLLCNEKLTTADPKIAEWFLQIKKEFPDVHISWAYRNKGDQDKMFAEGKSRTRYPHSKHNLEVDGRPCSQALDLFKLKEGKALFPHKFYSTIYDYSKKMGYSINWGEETSKGFTMEITLKYQIEVFYLDLR